MILLIGIIVLFIALIVFIVMSAKRTHWMNLVGVFFVFLFAIFYLTVAGMVFETRRNWQEVLKKNQEKYEKQEKELREALTGDPNDFEWPNDSLKGLETAAAQQVLGQGRVWRECKPSAFTPGTNPNDLTTGSLSVELPPNSPSFEPENDPDAGGDDAVDGTSLVYVFLEVADGAGGYKISSYIGSFFATEPTPTSVKLSPSLILPDPSNTATLKAGNPAFQTAREMVLAGGSDDSIRWAMYDILPIDSYDVFVDSIRAEAGDPDLEVTTDMLRKKLTKEYMPQEALRLSGEDEKYRRIIDSIVYTNRSETTYKDLPPGDKGYAFEARDDEKWYRVEFKRNFKNESFKVDFKAEGDAQKEIALQGQAFDRDGLALLEILKLGEDVDFQKDQSVLLAHSSWEKNPVDFIADMRESGDAVASEVIYRRKLNDFDYDFRALVESNKQLTSDRNHAAEKLAQLQTIDAAYEEQKTSRLEVSNKLNKDVSNFKKDKAAVEQYREQLESKLEGDRKEIDRYFRLTKELSAKKAELEAKLAEKIEENTRKAEAEAGDAE